MGGSIFTARGLANLGCLVFLALGTVTLLYVLLLAPPELSKLIHVTVLVILSSHISPLHLCRIRLVSISVV